MRVRLFWARGLFAALFVMVTYLTLTPDPDKTRSGFALARWVASLVLGNPDLADKVAHFLAYSALGAAAYGAQINPWRKPWAAPLALAVYGVLLEGLQGLGGVRTPELADAIANSLGALTGFAGAVILARFLKTRAI